MNNTLILTVELASLNPLKSKEFPNFTVKQLRELVKETDLPLPVTLSFQRENILGSVEALNLNSKGLLKGEIHLSVKQVQNLVPSKVYAAVGCSIHPSFKLFEVGLVSEHSDQTIQPLNWTEAIYE